jgi:drug/metabolite transporter (DMT)-like permease
MSRIKADLLLLLVALVWGAAFVSQKDAFAHVGAYTFVAARFFISMMVVLPFAIKEYRQAALQAKIVKSRGEIFLLCCALAGGIFLQQIGVGKTSVTNAGFLTALYVILVPVICMLVYKQKLSKWVFLASLISITGVWLLSNGGLDGFSFGDILVLGCALSFALHVTLVSRIMDRIKSPFILSFLQYAFVTILAIAGTLAFEHPTLADIRAAAWPIIYAGAVSGGIGYTLQFMAQQYTPATDSAIILSGESVFAAIFGALMLGERLTLMQYTGCVLIVLAIVLTEALPLFFKKKTAH